jgi:hypothetical protein
MRSLNSTLKSANYRLWLAAHPNSALDAARQHSTTLFDTVAVYLATGKDLCEVETLNLRVMDEGLTVVSPQGRKVHVAVRWKNLGGYEGFLVNRLTATNHR